MSIPKAKRGFTLIETIVVIIILGIALAPFSILVVNVISQNSRSQAWATAVALAEGELERVTGLRFSATANTALTPFAVPFSAYSSQVSVNYVNAGALDTPVAGPTDYKRVEVKVTSSLADTVTLTTLVANDW